MTSLPLGTRTRLILTEQRSNYLPLRVIKDRLETGEIDPTGEQHRPNGDTPLSPAADAEPAVEVVDVPNASVQSHPASRQGAAPAAVPTANDNGSTSDADEAASAPSDDAAEPMAADAEPSAPSEDTDDDVPAAHLMPGVLLDRAELCSMVGMNAGELEQLEGFGIVVPRDGTSPSLYGDDAVAIAAPACEFLRAGIDARHLRNWRTSAEREASLFEQLVTPRFRQRNPESHAEALTQLKRLDTLGGLLRAAMTKQALRRHFES